MWHIYITLYTVMYGCREGVCVKVSVSGARRLGYSSIATSIVEEYYTLLGIQLLIDLLVVTTMIILYHVKAMCSSEIWFCLHQKQ